MTKVTAEISMSLDGFVAGPNQTLEEPLGAGGEKLPAPFLCAAGRGEWPEGSQDFRG